ncbi:MAG: CBASS cGAMP synthase [Pseudomonas sp.]|nr:CBASS cGAMP synthase [Pseudomonas sp.]MDZ4193631.1 CBASS cGAMP synthase [Pseudomonas sp.]
MGRASSLFNGTSEQTLISRVSPTTRQREFLQNSWNALAEYLKESLREKYGYPISTWLQGSYKYGTLIKPVHPGEEYDVDLGVYFGWGKGENIEPTADQLRRWVQQELVDYRGKCADIQSVAEPPKERCSRASFQHQFHIDTPVYHLNSDTDRRRLACLTKGWEASDPKAFYKWFRDAHTGAEREQVRRLIRYLKAWAALSFDDIPDSRPSSIFLTVLATEAYPDIGLALLLGVADDDALISIIRTMHGRLNRSRSVQNPATKTEEDLNRMSEEAWAAFLSRLDALLDIAERAAEAADEGSAALIWSEAFSFLMPLPNVDEVELVDERTSRSLMQLPDIDITVYAGTGANRRFVATHRNRVAGVAKDCTLVFTIANPHIVPQFATVEWTVRNNGLDADAFSDLGHRKMGMRLLQSEERTSYLGTHHMDCIVRVNGQVYAARRVPVTIRDVQHHVRPPATPSYTRLRMKRRR